METENLVAKALAHGFSKAAFMDASCITLLPEVRAMCSTNKCGKYGACWTCPPACGDLTDCEARIRGYSQGLIVQTIGQLEDSMDYESMMEAEKRHKELFASFSDLLHAGYDKLLSLGSGGCRICEKCAYPAAPCRFPNRAFSSMEAYGMLVTDVCSKNGLSYYYGPNTIAYTACYLLY